MNLDTGSIRGYTDGLDAMKQAIFKILQTERYQYIMYSWNYGIETLDLYGEPISYVCPELERRITEALLWDERIESVDNFEFDLKIRKKTANGQMMNYSEWCSVNSYKGWLKHCDSYRLQKKYIEPIQSDTDRYYREVVKRKVA